MPERAVNTDGIMFDETVDYGYLKVCGIGEPRFEADAYVTNEDVSSDTYDSRMTGPYGEHSSWVEFLAGMGHKIKRATMPVLTATMIDLTRLSWDNQPTGTIFFATQAGELEIKRRRGTISPELIKPREQVHATSLIGPSGFVLGWLEMYGDSIDDEN